MDYIKAVRGVFTMMKASPLIPKISCAWTLKQGEINNNYSNRTLSFVSLPLLCRSQMEIQVETAAISPECTISTEHGSETR